MLVNSRFRGRQEALLPQRPSRPNTIVFLIGNLPNWLSEGPKNATEEGQNSDLGLDWGPKSGSRAGKWAEEGLGGATGAAKTAQDPKNAKNFRFLQCFFRPGGLRRSRGGGNFGPQTPPVNRDFISIKNIEISSL